MFKLIPRFKPYYTISDWLAAINIFQKNPIEKYESEFAKKFENNHGIMFQHGRTGLYALLKVWGLKSNEVICPAYTCVVVPNAIVLSGNTPVFVDCATNSFNMDLNLLEKAITEKTKAIIVTHLFGYPMDVIKVQDIVKKAEQKYDHKIYVIQDVAHSYGARWQGKLVTRYGDASIFGSNISKIINSIFGGIVLSNSNETYNKLKLWRNVHSKKIGISKEIKRFLYFLLVNIAFNSYIYSFVYWFERKGFLNRFVKYYEEDRVYFPYDWDLYPSKIEARVGQNQLKKYDYILNQKRINSKKWFKELEYKKIIFKDDIDGCTYSHCIGLVNNRKQWIEEYKEKGIQLGILIEYSIPYLKAYEQYKKGDYAISLGYSKQSINFPNGIGSSKLLPIEELAKLNR